MRTREQILAGMEQVSQQLNGVVGLDEELRRSREESEAEARLAAAPETARAIDDFLKDPSTGVVWNREKRKR